MAPGGTLPAARRIAAQVPVPRYLPKPIAKGAAKGPCSNCSPRESLLDFPEEEQHLCPECHLPIGYFGYENQVEDGEEGDGDAPKPGQVLHGECQAQLILRSLQEEEQARLASEQELKSSRRADYDIGWKADRIPDNAPHASELLGEAAQGLFCLVIDEDSHKVRVAPTTDPAAAVSLEYLSLALQVRKKEGREPLFSLDPEDDSFLDMTCLDEEPVDKLDQVKELMQVKRFEPDWLAGTSVGEVMFQADYHLKELSMGEYEQPVLGMKNCWEHEMTDSDGQDWRAREWFVVKKADVLISDGDVLIPCVEMGVEAREQVVGKDGQVEDAMVTRPDHPLVKYAEAFTHFFDLIAERKSVVYHLRELAKASVLAKFLLDDALGLDDAWFQLAKAGGEDSHMQIPQLWNARQFSRIHMCGGEILHAGEDDDILATGSHAVYGGVEFGIDRIKEFPSFSKRIPSTEKPDFQLQSLAAARLPGRQLGSRGIPARLGVRPARAFGAALGPAASIMARPQGVDLNLDRFSLSSATRVASQEPAGSWASQEGTPLTGEAFWSTLSENSSEPLITKEDKSMLKALFNPNLSDRRTEGERFVPPETSPEYVQRLRTLLEEEEAMQQQRREHFFSKAFSVEDVGPLFPGSWNTKFAVARTEVLEKEHHFKEWRVPREEEAEKLKDVLRSTAPSFDKTTEDGTRYRTYQVGNLEVRTTQEFNGQELVGAVFSDSPLDSAGRPGAADGQVVVKATEYVERLGDRAAPPAEQPPPHGFFVVILTAILALPPPRQGAGLSREMRAWGDGFGDSSMPMQRERDEDDNVPGSRRSRSREWSRGREPKGDMRWGTGGGDWGGGKGKGKGRGKGRRRRGGKGGGFREEAPSEMELDGELTRYFGVEAPAAPAPMGSEAEKAKAEKAAPAAKAAEVEVKDEAAVSAEEQKMRERARRFGLPGGGGQEPKEAAKAEEPKAEEAAKADEAAGKEAPANGAKAAEAEAAAGKA